MNWYEEKIKKHPAFISTKLTADLDVLYPPFALNILKTFAISRKEGLSTFIYETYRSQTRQLELFNKGATKLKTNGMHHFGVAADIIFLDDKNNLSWNEKHDWKRLGEIGKSMNLVWGGDWPWDKPHFQLIPATITDQNKIIRGEYPPYDPSIDRYIIDLLPLYKNLQFNKFSINCVTEIISYIEDIEKNRRGYQIIEHSPTTIVEKTAQYPPLIKQIPTEIKTNSTKSFFTFIEPIINALFRKKRP
jgi:hypothetical protein